MENIKLEITITPEAVREIFSLLGIKEIREEESNKEEENKENIYIREEESKASKISNIASEMANKSREIEEKANKPTSREEVIDYVIDNNLYMDGNQFFDYYESVGWKTKTGEAISDWKAACRGAASRVYDAEERKRLGNPQISSKEVKERIKLLEKKDKEQEIRYPDILPEVIHPKKKEETENG